MKLSVGHSNDPLADEAAREAIDEARAGLKGVPPIAAIVFFAVETDHECVLDALQETFPGLPVVGCTTDGELTSALQFQEDSVAIMLFGSDTVRARAGMGHDLAKDPQGACREALSKASIDDEVPALCVVFPESLTTSAVSLVGALNDILDEKTLLVGGTAGDQWQFAKTQQFCGTEVASDAIPVLCFYGDMHMGVGISSGWEPVGEQSTVTRAEGNIVYEIGGRPAVEFYTRYFGEAVEFNPEYPLGVLDEASDQYYLRAPMAHVEGGAVQFAGDVPEGAKVHVTTAGRDAILDACRLSIGEALESASMDEPTGALIISCAARKQVLGTRTSKEYEMLRERLGDVPVIGFYSYGEIAPMQGRRIASFHNETFVSVVFGERAVG